MKTVIMIIILASYTDYGSVTSVEYSSMAACKAARAEALKAFIWHNSLRGHITSVCTYK